MIGDTLRHVLFVDDDAMLRSANVQTLSLAGLEAQPCATAAEALAAVTDDFPGIVVTDVRMPGMDGLTLFARLHERDPELPVILVTGHADVPMAVAALKDGAWDFLAKPFASEQLVASVRRALATRQLVLENRALRMAAARAAEGDALVGETPAMQQLRRAMRLLADASVDVLVEGEAGTGKALVATMLHRWSARRGRRFVTVDCGMPSAPLAGELFGQHAGLADSNGAHDGWIVGADGGTLFLDGLDGLSLPLQAALLRVMEEREVVPLGGDRPRHVNVRFIASVTQAPERLVERGRLRPDLFYRLSAARLIVPPLRERREDTPLLFASLMHEAAARLRRPVPELDAALRSRLLTHDWPGNVRELAHVAEQAVLALDVPLARADDALSLPTRVQRFEADAIEAALAAHDGAIGAVLVALGLPRKTFYDKIARYAIDINRFRIQRRSP